MVWIAEGCTAPLNVVIHESVHVFQKLCYLVGEEEPGDEFAAYTIAHIAETILSDRILDALSKERGQTV